MGGKRGNSLKGLHISRPPLLPKLHPKLGGDKKKLFQIIIIINLPYPANY